MVSLRAQITNAGQSTLDKPIPSLHVKLDKNGNIKSNKLNQKASATGRDIGIPFWL